jgi:hypothetical protein
MTITVNDVEACFKETLRMKATPHREPDFKKIRATVGADCEVKAMMWFIEANNTGYDGLLERWEFRAEKDGKRISFWADLLPRLIVSAPPQPQPASLVR